MSLFKEIEPFIDYIHSIRKLENYLTFDMKFPVKWSLPKSIVDENKVVGFESGDNALKGISFVSQVGEKEMNITLSKIAKIIKLNKEKELKEKLFKETVEQLKQTFEKTDLDKLKNLYFDFDNEEPELNIEEEDEQTGEDIELGTE